MYHSRRNRTFQFLSRKLLTAIVALTTALPAFAALPADSSVQPQPLQDTTPGREPAYPVLGVRQRLKHKPDTAVTYQLDSSPPAGRTPLLLVHGLRGEYRELFRWDQVIKRLLASPQFTERFKIYLLRYDSTASLPDIIPQFKRELLQLKDVSGDQKITVLALSMGGNIVEESMLDKVIDDAIRLVFTMGTPFHGSPLFSSDWYLYSLYKNLSLPWTRVDHNLAYRLYFQRNPSLLKDLKWDNSDGYIPATGPFRSLLPLGPKGDLTIAREANERLQRLNLHESVDKSKFITYAGYLLNPYQLPTLRRQVETTVLAPYTILAVQFPAHLAREHPVLKMLNREISRILPARGIDPLPENWPHVYGLNDGITPVNSAIFLSARTLKSNPICREEDVAHLRGETDVKLARVFRNIDHLTFIDGYRPGVSSSLLRDELNPQDGYRQIFDWILSDLLNSQPLPNHLAGESAADSLPPARNGG